MRSVFRNRFRHLFSQSFVNSQSNLPSFNGAFSRAFLSTKTMNDGERIIYQKLKESFDPSFLEVEDVSGGCGSMYAINIKTTHFQNKSLVQQHRLVNEVLKDDIKSMHGLQLKTSAS